MDDTQQSRTSDAAATRKRRSSILKSQRPPRAPLSELEFHVTTPTDTAKSRRVSFSRRTGVAEFVTNEATTTWKNFYEEHNKTLESSGNESEANAPRPSSVGHLGKRIFEDQFQDCEAIDFGSSSKAEYNNIALDSITDDRKLPTPQQHFELSAVTATDSKLFEDNFAVSRLGEITDKIDVDFSIMQPVGDDLDEIQKDIERVANNGPNAMCQGPVYNMSEYIEVDLNATHGGLAADDAASDDMSITDTIHSPKVNVSSIADPKDKSLDKDWVTDKENIAVNPYIAPKETNNFAINEESDKVLVFDGKRLTVQSEKEPLSDYRKTLLPNARPEKTPQRKTIVLNVDDDLPNFVANPHASMIQHSQNISLSITANEEFDVSLTQPIITQPIEAKIVHKQINENVNMHVPVTGIGSEKRRTIVYESDSADISMTQALPSNVILNAPLENDVKATVLEDEIVHKEKRNTIVFETGSADVSMTQAVPANIILNMKGSSKESPNNTPVKRQRRTIVFDNEAADISVTQALHANVILNAAELPEPVFKGHVAVKEKQKTIVFENDAADISLTQALPANVILSGAGSTEPVHKEKRKTIVFENDAADISLTQALPANVILSGAGSTEPVHKEKRKTIVFENDAADISLTQALPANVILSGAGSTEPVHKEKRKTIVFENDAADISVTQALPANLILSGAGIPEPVQKEKRKTIVFENDAADISVTQALPVNVILNAAGLQEPARKEKRKTIVFENDAADISVTQALPSNFILSGAKLPEPVQKEKRKTIVFDNDAADISVTQALIENVILNTAGSAELVQKETRKTVVFGNEDADISVTQALSANVILNAKSLPTEDAPNKRINIAEKEKRKTIVLDSDSADISMTQALPTHFILNEAISSTQEPPNKEKTTIFEDNTAEKEKRKTIVFDRDSADISMIQALPANFILNEEIPSTQEPPDKYKTVFQEKNTRNEKRKTVVLDSDSADISMTQALPSNFIIETISSAQQHPNQKKSIVFEENIGIAEKNKRNTIVFDNDAADISMTEVLPSNMILDAAAAPEPDKKITANKRKTIVYDSDSADISVTQAVPANVILSVAALPENKIKAIVFEDESAMKEKRKTVVFENDAADVSITQTLPANVILKAPDSPIQEPPSKRKTIVFNNEEANISLIQPLPVNSVITEKGQTYSVKRRTVVYETDVGSISITEVVPPMTPVPEKSNATVFDENEEDLSRIKTIPVSGPLNEEMGLTYDVLPQTIITEHKSSITTDANKTYSVRSDLCVSKTEALPANKISLDITTADGDDDSFNISVTQAIPSNIIFGNETRKLEAELELSAADVSEPANLLPSEKDKDTELLKKEADISKLYFSPNKQGKAIEKLNSKTSETSPSITPRNATKLSASELDVIENTEPIPKKSLPPVFALPNDKKPPTLISQENSDALSKPVNLDATHGANIVVYQAAITGNQLGVLKNEIEYASSDLTESGSSNGSYRDRNVVPMCESSDMEQKEFKEASKSTSALCLSGASVPSVMDRSCSVIKIDTSPAKTSILDSLLDMDDSLISHELLDKGLSTIETTSPVCIARATSPAQSEEVFRVTREKENETKKSGDAEKQKKEVTKKTDNESSLLAVGGKKRGTTPSPGKSPVKPSPDSAKKESPKRNRFFEKFTRRSKGKQRNQDDTADLLDLISKFADKSDYEETKTHVIKDKREEKDTIKEQESAKKENPVLLTQLAASKRPSITRSPEKLTRQNSMAVPKRQSIIDTENISRRASLAVRRQSIVLSREELMNNISMAAQALQRETNSPDITEDSPPSPDPEPMEVVKILNFDDDETPEHDYNSQLMTSPLKKTFGDTYVEGTGNKSVIPSFCENVSDGVKSLMMDLIKPMADTLPFDVAACGEKDRQREIDIPANLITTRNVDTESDSCTSSEALVGMLGITKNQEYIIICDDVTTSSSKSEEEVWHEHHHEARNDDIPTLVFDPNNPLNNVLIKARYVESVHRYNPDPTPVPSEIGLKLDEQRKTDVSFKPTATGGVKVEVYDETKQYLNYNVQSKIPDHIFADMKYSETSNNTAESKPVTADASVITCGSATKDQKVNTVIAMQENATILRGNSSLTIINSIAAIGAGETPKSHTADSHKHTKHSEKQSKDTNHSEKHSKDSKEYTKYSEKHHKHSEKHHKHSEKHTKDIEKQTQDIEKISQDSEKHSKHSEKHSKHSDKHTKHSKEHTKHIERHTQDSEKYTKDNQENGLHQPNTDKKESDPQTTEDTYKRKHSPVKHLPDTHFDTSLPLNDLPTDTHFIQENVEEKFTATHERSPAHKKLRNSTPNSKKKSPKIHTDVGRSRKIKEIDFKKVDKDFVKTNTQVIVHRCAVLNTVHSSEPHIPQEEIVVKSETESQSDEYSLTSQSGSLETLTHSWGRPQQQLVSEQGCKVPVASYQDNVNVCQAIRDLPCMSLPEVCTWETVSSERWRFLMLHGRLELAVGLGPKRGGGAGSEPTGADTPVTSVDVLPALIEEKRSSRGELCVRFLSETIRTFISEHGCSRAGELPSLVRRCGAASKAALRWAKSMHHAWAHLAYKLDHTGVMTLTVANFHMRQVWEVRMRIELSQWPSYAAPFPRANHVRVDKIFGDYVVSDTEVQSVIRDVTTGWGHAPATLWKIFKHLKHKTHKSDLI